MTLLYLFLFLIPFQFALNPAPGVDLAIGRVFALFLVIFIFAALLKKRSLFLSHSPISILLFLFLLWSGFSLLWSDAAGGGFRKLIFLANFFPLFWLLPNILNNLTSDVRRTSDVKKLKPILLYPALIVSLVGILQFAGQFVFGIDSVFNLWAGMAPFLYGEAFAQSILAHNSWLVDMGGQTLFRAIAFFPDPHIFGFYLAFVTPLAFFSKRTLFKMFGFIFVLALFLTFSRAAYVGALSAFVSFSLIALSAKREAQSEKPQRKTQSFKFLVMALTFTLLVLSLLFTPIGSRFISSFNLYEGSIAGRLENWGQAIGLIKNAPLIGSGLGSYAASIEPAVDYRVPIYAHNLYLDIWAELGLVGLLLFLGILGSAIAYSFKRQNYPLLLTFIWFAVQAMFDTPLWSVHILPLFIIFLGLIDSSSATHEAKSLKRKAQNYSLKRKAKNFNNF